MFNIPDPTNNEAIADWVEFFVAAGHEGLSKSQLRAYVEESSAVEPSDDDIDSVWLELEKREALYGSEPPYMVQRGIVEAAIDWNEHPEYMACLVFALAGNSAEPLRSGTLFERITEEALRHFIGGKSLVVGFPSTVSVEEIANSMQEKYIAEPPWYRKDRDLDIVAWMPFDDGRCSQVVILAQCAAGFNWPHKKKDLNLDAWCKYLHFACRPIKAFSIPVIISDRTKLEEDSTDAGIIIDRVRIYRNVIHATPVGELRKDVRGWCNERLAEMLDNV